MKALALSLLLCLCAAALPTRASTPGEVMPGGLLREASMQGLSIPPKKLSEFRGKPLLINVWASWCGPCGQEMGSIEQLARRYGGKQFNVIGISTDDYEDRAKFFLLRHRISFNNYIDSRLLLENMLGASNLPLTLLVDAEGRVIAKFYGSKQWDSPEALAVIAKAFRVKL